MSQGQRLLAGLVVAVIVFAPAVILGGRWLGEWDCSLGWELKPDACSVGKEHAKAINDARTTLAQLLLAIAAGGTLYATWQGYKVSQESRNSENFIKAVEQLGSKEVSVRVGGLAGLGRLLRFATPKNDYWPLMDVLSAFVRSRQAAGGASVAKDVELPEDIQFALNQLARRAFPKTSIYEPSDRKDAAIDFYQANLTNAWMAAGHFEWSHFRETILVGADLADALLNNTNLYRPQFLRHPLEA